MSSCVPERAKGRQRAPETNGGDQWGMPEEPITLRRAISQRLQWVREAYMAHDPRHTQEAWAHICGVSAASFSRWEAGILTPPLTKLVNLSYACWVPMDCFTWGVLDKRRIPVWLYNELLAAHPGQFVDFEVWLQQNAQHAQTVHASPAGLGQNQSALMTPAAQRRTARTRRNRASRSSS
jgi:hypothetical protein